MIWDAYLLPTLEEQQSFEGKSPFYIKQLLKVLEKTPSGSQKKVKQSRKIFVPRLKSIHESNIMTKRNKTLSSISTTSFEQSHENSFKSFYSIEREENKQTQTGWSIFIKPNKQINNF